MINPVLSRRINSELADLFDCSAYVKIHSQYNLGTTTTCYRGLVKFIKLHQ